MRAGLALNVFLAFTWTLLIGEVTLPQLIVGFLLGFPLLACAERLGRPSRSAGGAPSDPSSPSGQSGQGSQRSQGGQGVQQGLGYTAKAPKLLLFALRFVGALVRANLQVAHDVLTRHRYANPGVLAIPLRAETDLELTLLANLVTLTPGTLSLDVCFTGGRRVLYVHAMFAGDPERVRQEIRDTFETPLLELLR